MSEIVAEGIIPAADLQQFVDTVHSLLDECRVHFNDDGLYVCGIGPENVVMYTDCTLSAEAFEHYEAPGSVTQGVNLERFDEVLNPANGDDLVELALDMETRKLRVGFRNIDQEMRLIDPDSIRTEPDTPDLDLPNTFTADGASYREVLKVADTVSDHLRLCGDADEETVEWVADGDLDTARITFDGGVMDGHDIGESVDSLYSIEMLEYLVDAFPSDAAVTCTFGDDFPTEFEYLACDGHLDVNGLVAPRIESE